MKITGYRELTEEEIDNINSAKELERKVLDFINVISMPHASAHVPDQRWLSIAKTDIQKGFMALARSIARPDGY